MNLAIGYFMHGLLILFSNSIMATSERIPALNTKLSASVLDKYKMLAKTGLRKYMTSAAVNRKDSPVGFRVCFRLSDAYDCVVRQEHEASTIRLQPASGQDTTGQRSVPRFNPSPDRIGRRMTSTLSMVDTTASTGQPSLSSPIHFPKMKSNKSTESTRNTQPYNIENAVSKNENTKKTKTPSIEQKNGIIGKDQTEVPPTKKPKKSDTASNDRRESKWKLMKLKKIPALSEDPNKTKIKKVLQAFNRKETASVTSSNKCDANKTEDPDEDDGVPVAQYLYKLINCREATNPEIILQRKTEDNQVIN